MTEQRVKTPCIGICSTVFGDIVCRGCKRYSHEIIAWNGYSEAEKQAVMERLKLLSTQVIQHLVEIVDEPKLRQQLEVYRVRFDPNHSPYWWVYELLKAKSKVIEDLRDCGVKIRSPFQALPLPQLKDKMDEDFLVITEAHYDRYIIWRESQQV